MSKKTILLIAGISFVVLFIGVRAIYSNAQQRLEERRRQEQIAKTREAMKQLQQQFGSYAQVQQGLASMANYANVNPSKHFNPGPYKPMQANFTYSYNLSSKECRSQCVEYQEERKFEGSVHLAADSVGYLVGQGSVQMTVNKHQQAYDQYCKKAEWKDELQGAGHIDVEAGGETPVAGVIKTSFAGDSLAREGVKIGCDGKTESLNGTGSAGASCEFHNVDLVHGGTYSAFENGDGHGTCKLEIFPE